MAQPPVIVLTGQLAAGKSTLARAVLARFPFGYHVDVDALREGVASGIAHPVPWTAETGRQFGLAVEAAVAIARLYHAAGFAVVIDGAIDASDVSGRLARAGLEPFVTGVVLRPPVEVAIERNHARRTKAFDTSFLDEVIRRLDGELALPPPPGWHVIDNGRESAEATVRRILALAGAG